MKNVLLLLALFCGFADLSGADSLWPNGAVNNGGANSVNMITDRRALKIGDLVTVRIIEQASAEQDTNVTTQKQASVAGTAGLGSWNNSGSAPIQGYGAGANENFAGGGSSARSGKIVTTLTARVISILDSGNLVIEGRRSLKINDEKQHIYVRGVIRPGDVGRDNSIASTSISDAQIMYEGKGPLSEKSKPGFLTRILDWLWIF